jgi:ribosome-associated heat shock protein Hsp15
MRLDLFLKSSRLVIRRTIAQELCEAGYVKVNGVMARSSRSLKADDVVELRRRNKITTFRVAQIPLKKQVSIADAANLYAVLSEEFLEESPLEILLEESENNAIM